MSDGLLMGLDVGGGGGRCLLLDLSTGHTTVATRSWKLESVPGSGGLAFEVDLESLWSALGACAREALARSGRSPADVTGVAATSLRLGTVVIDERGDALLAVPNRDARAAGEGIRLAIELGEELHQVTGRWPNPIFALPRLQWLATQHPDRWNRAATLLSLSDWVTWRLSGERVCEASQAGETLLFDLASRDWAWDWIDRFELPRRLFPEVSVSGARVGTLRSAAARELGLPSEVPVALGGADTQCGLLGVGALAPGEAAAIAGTTAPVEIVLDRPVVDPTGRLWSGHHLEPGRWVLESNAGPMGEALSWFAKLTYPDAPQPEARLLAEAAQSDPGAAGMLSTLGAEVMNGRELAMPLGNLSLCHLSSEGGSAARGHLARSIAEGMACAIRANLDQLTEATEFEPTALRLAGGLSRSPSFAQILADVVDLPVLVGATAEATALGAALCAGVGAGAFSSLREAADKRVILRDPLNPDPDSREIYRELYGAWQSLKAKRAEADREATSRATGFALRALARPATTLRERPRPKIFVSADCDAESLRRFTELGDLTYASFRNERRLLKEDSLIEALAGFEVFVTEIDLVDAASLDSLPDLRVIATCRGDAVNVDVRACTAYGIPVLNTPGRNADAVADLTLTFLLMLARKIQGASGFLREPGGVAGDLARMGKAFSRYQGRELWQKTVGLVGLGAVGRAVAKRLTGFGCRVLVSDPYVDAERAATADTSAVSLETLLAESDFVSLHAAVTEETRGMLGARQFEQMKPGAGLVNTARAALLDEEALVAALESGHLGGAALDTFAVEPPAADHPLLALENVVATPHVGGNTVDVAAHQARAVVADLERLLEGRTPAHLLNPETLSDLRWSSPRRVPDSETRAALSRSSAPAVTDLQKSEPGGASRP